jgi:hypothetical protein
MVYDGVSRTTNAEFSAWSMKRVPSRINDPEIGAWIPTKRNGGGDDRPRAHEIMSRSSSLIHVGWGAKSLASPAGRLAAAAAGS